MEVLAPPPPYSAAPWQWRFKNFPGSSEVSIESLRHDAAREDALEMLGN
jgi:hypothetical protein